MPFCQIFHTYVFLTFFAWYYTYTIGVVRKLVRSRKNYLIILCLNNFSEHILKWDTKPILSFKMCYITTYAGLYCYNYFIFLALQVCGK